MRSFPLIYDARHPKFARRTALKITDVGNGPLFRQNTFERNVKPNTLMDREGPFDGEAWRGGREGAQLEASLWLGSAVENADPEAIVDKVRVAGDHGRSGAGDS